MSRRDAEQLFNKVGDSNFILCNSQSCYETCVCCCCVLCKICMWRVSQRMVSVLCSLSYFTCLTSNMRTPTMMMQSMLTAVRVRLIMPRQNSSRGMSPCSAYSNLKPCTQSHLSLTSDIHGTAMFAEWVAHLCLNVGYRLYAVVHQLILEAVTHHGHGPVEAGVNSWGQQGGGDGHS